MQLLEFQLLEDEDLLQPNIILTYHNITPTNLPLNIVIILQHKLNNTLWKNNIFLLQNGNDIKYLMKVHRKNMGVMRTNRVIDIHIT